MKAAYITKPRNLTVGDFPEPSVGPYDVLLRIAITGICGSDIEVYNGGYPEIKYPVIMGHETSGIVTKLGKNVRSRFKIGDRVTCEPSWGCGRCYFCNSYKQFYKLSNHCTSPQKLGRSANGSYAEYAVVPAENVYALPHNVSFDQAQSTTTLACLVHGIWKLGTLVGDTIAVLGTGHAGLLAQQVAKACGASKVIVVGRKDEKLRLSKELGSDETINMKKDDVVQRLLELTDGVGPDEVIEATGVAEMFKIGISAIKPTGRVVQFGIPGPPGNFELNAMRLMYKEIELVGTASGRGCYPTALQLMSKGRVKIDPLVTHRFNLMDLEKGIEVMEKKIDNPIRVLINSAQ